MKGLSALSILTIFALCTGASAGQVLKSNTSITKKSGHSSTPIVTNVEITPAGGAPIPIPLPSITTGTGKSAKKIKSNSNNKVIKRNISTSAGDEVGAAKGVVSGKQKGKASFKVFTSDVKVDGKNVTRLGDAMLQNKKNIAK